ncbi:liver carboxylesterase 1-like [Amphiprion ocellaris]|uniref:liver carboxylesterase 1-like n=1 Tax=Amphiprion ocellaris TaxID=80972 RepID=UPI0024118EA2|nr:liver carboxylesterase 1-like [Amphiprion ocellaris]
MNMKLHAKHTVCFLISVLFAGVAAELQAPEVHTKLGSLRGEYVSVKGKETGVHAYLGVPFAKPPIGPSLRLAPPQPVEGWKGVRDATKQPPMCIQSNQITVDMLEVFGVALPYIPDISEDCLYLNIYTPANRAKDAKLPVMVWIHGGGLSTGSASMYDGSALAAYQDVVVVLIQYRLGLLGFLSTGDEHISGNFGMLDQVEALRWVQQHIHNFGGDPDSVTIFGESAGGMSVSLLLLSPLSDDLFHRAIAESGTAAMDFLVSSNPLAAMQMAANASGCSIESTEKFADCMRNLDINAIVAIGENKIFTFHANVDGHFLTKPVDELLRKHELLTVPFITGVNDDEGGFILANFFAPPNWTEGIDREQVLNVMSIFCPDPRDAIKRDLMVDEYIGTGEDRVKNRDGLTELIGDILFNIPVIKVANGHRDAGAAVYLYEYQHPPLFLQKKRPSFVGSDHADEMFIVLGFCFTTTHVKLIESCTEEEEELSRTMMSYWGNFARTGSPNGDGLVHWPKYGAEEEYLAIGLKEQVVGRALKKDRFVFMTQTLPEKIQQHTENTEHSEQLQAPEVHTKLGSLRGEYVSVKGKETGVHAYLGVPFAKPPIGPSLRLAPPQPVEGWKGVRDATKQPPMCIQNAKMFVDMLEVFGVALADIPDISEDCLYLNIYTPANRAKDAKLPVMVWIHGGGFSAGSASAGDGSALAAYQDVVVVLIQYRLGLLGFLSTGDEHVSGNFGMLDQIEALRWVQQHIHNFGGDPDLVTIFGVSAGGVSVSLLLLSPLSDGLFHRAIAESGTAAMDLLVSNNPLPAMQMVANASGCSIESTEKIADCMRNLDIDTIVAAGENHIFTFHANIDGHFLMKPVDELLRKHELLTIPFITGFNDDEGGFILTNFFAPPNWTEGLDQEQVVNVMSGLYPDPKDAVKRDLMMKEYFGTGEDRVKNREGLTEMIGDVIFNIPAIKVANAHRDAGAAVYLYEFQHPTSFMQKHRPSFVGSDHGDEMFIVLGNCFTTTQVKLTEPCPKEEEELSRTIMSFWGNFARTGSPNEDGLTHWPKYGTEEEYLAIGLKEQVVGQGLKKDRFVFMTQTLPEKIQQHTEYTEHSEL